MNAMLHEKTNHFLAQHAKGQWYEPLTSWGYVQVTYMKILIWIPGAYIHIFSKIQHTWGGRFEPLISKSRIDSLTSWATLKLVMELISLNYK